MLKRVVANKLWLQVSPSRTSGRSNEASQMSSGHVLEVGAQGPFQWTASFAKQACKNSENRVGERIKSVADSNLCQGYRLIGWMMPVFCVWRGKRTLGSML